jgi:hypothetical protein
MLHFLPSSLNMLDLLVRDNLTNAIRAGPAPDWGRDGRHDVLGRLLVHVRSPVLAVTLGVKGGACFVALA